MMHFNPPVVDHEKILNFGVALQGNAAKHGQKPALIVGDRTISWAEFGAMVAQVTGKLVAQGVGQGDTVASLSENSVEHVVLYCAVVASGACIVPLPFSATPAALAMMMADSNAELLFVSSTQTDTGRDLPVKQIVDLDRLMIWAADAASAGPAQVNPDDLFNIIYSSGTTGTPKGIIHDHRFRSRQLNRITNFGLTRADRLVISTPIYSNTTLFGMLPTLALGATLIVMPKFNAAGFLKLSADLKPTHAVLVPVQLTRLMAEPTFDDHDLSSYRCKFSTSAPLPSTLIAQVMERWPGNLIEIYGMTEGGISTALNCEAFPDKWDTVGRLGEGVDMRVIDDQGKELPKGSFGELIGRSASMMRNYHNAPEKTRELLWTDEHGDHFIRSGDMGRIDEDGFVHLMDRKKDMIISGGFNIYAADLEAVLLQHSDVSDAAVIAIPSDAWGETPLGFVVLRTGAAADVQEVLGFANAKLGKTQRLSNILLMDDLPRSEIGKVLKKNLRGPYWSS